VCLHCTECVTSKTSRVLQLHGFWCKSPHEYSELGRSVILLVHGNMNQFPLCDIESTVMSCVMYSSFSAPFLGLLPHTVVRFWEHHKLCTCTISRLDFNYENFFPRWTMPLYLFFAEVFGGSISEVLCSAHENVICLCSSFFNFLLYSLSTYMRHIFQRQSVTHS
jgi:hypothetical protein